MTTQDKVIKAPEGRVQRKPIGRGGKLDVANKQPGYVYRIINASADPGRVDRFKEAGYEIAVDGESMNGKAFNGAQENINLQGGDKGVLMKIKKEYYDEDQEAKMKESRDKDRQMDRKAIEEGLVGTIKRERD